MSTLYFIVIVSLITSTSTLPNGAPTKVCRSMLPYHGGGIPPQLDTSPYLIAPETPMVSEGSRLRVIISSPLGNQFQGYMLQARSPINGQALGRFAELPSAGAKALRCDAPDDTVTHENTNPKSELQFEWEPPEGYLGPIVFNSTIAQDYATFWVGVESPEIQVVKRDTVIPLPPSTTRRPLRPTTFPPNLLPNPEENESKKNSFYDGCKTVKNCFGSPNDCVDTRNCKAAVAIIVKGEKYEFELYSPREAIYVAVGLSDDDKMGDDSVIECVIEGNSVRSYMSYTSPRLRLDAIRLPNPQYGIRLINSSVTDGSLYCRVERDSKTTVQGKEYDLINGQFHILVAAGSRVHENKISIHDITKLASAEKKSLADTNGFTGASKLLLRLHGAFMIIAWIGTASLGMLVARYFKQTWVGSQICGKDIWFAWHRFFMVLTWALTTAGFIIIFVELKAWSSERNPHAILGVITTAICFLQPIGAFFRPHPGTPNRPFFNWGHWLGGNVAHILAIITIFFAVQLNKAELPYWMDWILVAFVAFHVIMHFILSLCSWLQILGCMSDKPSGHRVNSFPMKEMGSTRHTPQMESKMDAPYSFFRKFMLALYIIGLIVLVVILVVIVVLAPIEETLESLRKNMPMT